MAGVGSCVLRLLTSDRKWAGEAKVNGTKVLPVLSVCAPSGGQALVGTLQSQPTEESSTAVPLVSPARTARPAAYS